MTAKEARRLQTLAAADVAEGTRLLLGIWHKAIAVAARAGLSSVKASDLDEPHCPIPQQSHAEAFERLKADGFTIRQVSEGPNEATIEVSW